MARKKTPTLTEAEIRLMNVVWDKGKATVNEVIEALPRKARPAYNSVLTIMRILEEKGYLKHIKEGRAHVYCPRVSRDQAQRKVVRHLVKRFFGDSPEQLVLSILENEKMDKKEIDRLKAMIEDSEKK